MSYARIMSLKIQVFVKHYAPPSDPFATKSKKAILA